MSNELKKLIKEEIQATLKEYGPKSSAHRGIQSDRDVEIIEQASAGLIDEVVNKFLSDILDKSDYFDSLVTDKLGMNIRNPRMYFAQLVLKKLDEKIRP